MVEKEVELKRREARIVDVPISAAAGNAGEDAKGLCGAVIDTAQARFMTVVGRRPPKAWQNCLPRVEDRQ